MEAVIFDYSKNGKVQRYYCHYTICDQTPAEDDDPYKDAFYDSSMWHKVTEEEKKVLREIPMDGEVFVQGALEVPVLMNDYTLEMVRVLFQKSDNNGCSVFACTSKEVIDTVVPDDEDIRMDWTSILKSNRQWYASN